MIRQSFRLWMPLTRIGVSRCRDTRLPHWFIFIITFSCSAAHIFRHLKLEVVLRQNNKSLLRQMFSRQYAASSACLWWTSFMFPAPVKFVSVDARPSYADISLYDSWHRTDDPVTPFWTAAVSDLCTLIFVLSSGTDSKSTPPYSCSWAILLSDGVLLSLNLQKIQLVT